MERIRVGVTVCSIYQENSWKILDFFHSIEYSFYGRLLKIN